MARLLLLLLVPLAIVQLAAWWRRYSAPPQLATEPPIDAEAHLENIVRRVLFRLHGRATRQLVRLETAIAETLKFPGDRQALEELLTVLCGHAIEITPCGRVLVTASHRGGSTAITIVDDGIGVATARTARVLDLSREALALLGGTLDVRQRQGVGTTMTILLPAPASAPAGPWNATIRNTMADFARVTESHTDRASAANGQQPDTHADQQSNLS